MSNTIEKKTHTAPTGNTASTPASASTGATASTSSAEHDQLEQTHRGRRWFEETKGAHVNVTPAQVPNSLEQDLLKVSDLQDWRKKA